MDQIIIRCALEAAEKRMDEGKFQDALQILEALESQGEKQPMTPFCREMKALEAMALQQWRRDIPGTPDIMQDFRIRMLLGEGGQSWNYLVEDRENRWSAMKVRKAFRPHSLWPGQTGAVPPYVEDGGHIALLRECLEPFLLEKLRGNPNVVTLKDWRLAELRGMATVHIFTEPLLPLLFYTGHDAARLGVDICSALCEMHRQNIFHRDIKFENIYIDRDGRFKLGDFGSAVIVSGDIGSDGRRRSLSVSSSEDTVPAFISRAIPFGASPSDSAEPAALSAYDIRSLGRVMAELYLRGHGDPGRQAEALDRRVREEQAVFEATDLGRIILRAMDTDAHALFAHSSYASVEALREALLGVVGAPEDVREDFDRFFATDCRARLIIEHPFSNARLHDGRPVKNGNHACFRLMHYGHEGPDAVTVTRRMTLTPGAFDADRLSIKQGDLPYGNDGSQVLDPNRFEDRNEVEITAKYPDGFEARWTVEMAVAPAPVIATPSEPPDLDIPESIWNVD